MRTTSGPRATQTILQPATNVVCVARPLDLLLLAELEECARERTFHHEAQLDTTAPDPSSLLASLPEGAMKDFLAADIATLTRTMGQLLQRRHVHVELAVNRSDSCRKIHTDNVSLRLLCTYAGPGTEWLPDEDLLRERLGASGLDAAVANRAVLRPGGRVRHCDPGDILLLKGEAYPGNRGRGAAHRSPPIAADGLSRLVLKIDEHPCGC